MDDAVLVYGLINGQIRTQHEIEPSGDLVKDWYGLCSENIWIRGAYDPIFTLDSFYECKSVDELVEKLEHGNWCLGNAFYYKNICFIQQVDGGDEWLVIRDNIVFESWSAGRVIREGGELGKERFVRVLSHMLWATPKQLRSLNYMKSTPPKEGELVATGQKE
jgi:hypothetical protein